jgi:threonine/homoserine/homoserine lactone efflux protein
LGGVVHELVGFVGFAFVGTVTPGPNNTVLWGSGMRFGFRRTVPHVLGTAVGMALLMVGVGAGIGVLFDTLPAAEVVLKVVGSIYLLTLAVFVLRSGGVGRAEVAHPFGLWQGAGFQFVNPKAWVFSLAAVGTFLPADLPRVAGIALLTGTLAAIVIASSSIWAAGGAALGRLLDDERSRRWVGVGLAVLLVASVAFLWI